MLQNKNYTSKAYSKWDMCGWNHMGPWYDPSSKMCFIILFTNFTNENHAISFDFQSWK